MKNYVLLFLVFFTVAFSACDSKDDDAPPAAVQSKSQMLTGKKWVITAETTTDTDSSGTTTTDSFASYTECELDNTIFFATDGTVTFDEGANLCPGQPQTVNSTWAFANNETQIILGSGGQAGNLIELTSSKLVIESTFSFGGITSVITTTYGPQ